MTTEMTTLYAVTVANDVLSQIRSSGSFSTVLVEATNAAHARTRTREAGLLLTSCGVNRVSVYGLRFHGGHKVLNATGEVTRQAHWQAS